MQYLRNTWYVAMWDDDLSPDQLVSRTICEQPIVFYRRLDGSAPRSSTSAPIASLPLSQGRLCGDEVQCPYHGLRYDSTGTCVENPHGSGRITPALHLSSFTVEVRHSLVWVWIGERAR